MRCCAPFLALVIGVALGSSPLEAHPGHKHLVAAGLSGARSTVPDGIRGQGAMRFRVLYASVFPRRRVRCWPRPRTASPLTGVRVGGKSTSRCPGQGFFASAPTSSRSTC